ncbi:MAG: amidohydrolase family protein, partial [Chloroflexi bacterium]|nr:amidohydrolase family protein [Chloroflexota bacterium]
AMSLPELITRLTSQPAALLGKKIGSLAKGNSADIVLLDPNASWTVSAQDFASLSRNTPLEGVILKGRVAATVFGGNVVWDVHTAPAGVSS